MKSEIIQQFKDLYINDSQFRRLFHQYLLPELQSLAVQIELVDRLNRDLSNAKKEKDRANTVADKTVHWLSGMDNDQETPSTLPGPGADPASGACGLLENQSGQLGNQGKP